MLEKQAIRAALIARGLTDETQLHFAVAEAYMAAHRGDPDYRETSARLNAKWAEEAERRFAAGETTREAALTLAEWRHMADHFAGANDPVGQGLFHKALEALAVSST